MIHVCLLQTRVDASDIPMTTGQRRYIVKLMMHKLSARLEIEFGAVDPREDYFLRGNRLINQDCSIPTIRMNTYTDLMVQHCVDGDVSTSKSPAA